MGGIEDDESETVDDDASDDMEMVEALLLRVRVAFRKRRDTMESLRKRAMMGRLVSFQELYAFVWRPKRRQVGATGQSAVELQGRRVKNKTTGTACSILAKIWTNAGDMDRNGQCRHGGEAAASV